MRKVVGGLWAVVQPLEEISVWEKALIECAHDARVGVVGAMTLSVVLSVCDDLSGRRAYARAGCGALLVGGDDVYSSSSSSSNIPARL